MVFAIIRSMLLRPLTIFFAPFTVCALYCRDWRWPFSGNKSPEAHLNKPAVPPPVSFCITTILLLPRGQTKRGCKKSHKEFLTSDYYRVSGINRVSAFMVRFISRLVVSFLIWELVFLVLRSAHVQKQIRTVRFFEAIRSGHAFLDSRTVKAARSY